MQSPTSPTFELLTQTQAQVMRFVHDNPGCSASDIATAGGLLRANVSPALRVLKDRGYITSERDDADGRAIRIHSTPLADDTIGALRRSWAELIARAWERGEVASTERQTHDVAPEAPPDGVVVALERIREGLRVGRANIDRDRS